MKEYAYYIFDLDGTITDTLAVWLGIFRDGLVRFGITPPDDKTLSQHTHDWKELVHVGLPKDKVSDFAAFAHVAANERLPQAQLHVGAYETLEALKNHDKRIAIFSTMDRAIFEPAFRQRNLGMIAEVAVAGDDVSNRKPQPDGILKALHDLDVAPNSYTQAVYIGDKDTDIQAANNAGIDSILYYPAAHQLMYDLEDMRAHKPKAIISDWQELLAPFQSKN